MSVTRVVSSETSQRDATYDPKDEFPEKSRYNPEKRKKKKRKMIFTHLYPLHLISLNLTFLLSNDSKYRKTRMDYIKKKIVVEDITFDVLTNISTRSTSEKNKK